MQTNAGRPIGRLNWPSDRWVKQGLAWADGAGGSRHAVGVSRRGEWRGQREQQRQRHQRNPDGLLEHHGAPPFYRRAR